MKILCPGADNDFLCEQLGRKVTEDQARTAWAEEQNRRLEAKEQEIAEAKAQTAAAQDAGGVDPVATTGAAKTTDSEPMAAWNEAVAEKVKAGMSRPKAVAAVARENPELREAMVQAYNEEHSVKRR